jgi:hypothetical protein
MSVSYPIIIIEDFNIDMLDEKVFEFNVSFLSHNNN